MLGPKWGHLSALVHKLVETALARTQGPSDHFIAVDELSYVVTFRDLSMAQADLACIAVAKEVCQMLFGDQIDEISVRSIAAAIAEPAGADIAHLGKLIEEMVEKSGTETIVTKSKHSGSIEPVVTPLGSVPRERLLPLQEIEGAHETVAKDGLRLGLFPIWELRRNASSSLLLAPFSGTVANIRVSGRRALDGMDEKKIAEIEIALLRAAAAYGARIHDASQICAVGVGVSYGSLSVFQSRIRFITALQKIHAGPSSPILLKIEQIPEGTPVARIAELVAMMRFPHLRVTLEFQSLVALPEMDMRLGAVGLGGAIPQKADYELAVRIAEKLVRRAVDQKAFAFLDRLDTVQLVNAANHAGIRFGTGTALGTRHFAGTEAVPGFPLSFAPSG